MRVVSADRLYGIVFPGRTHRVPMAVKVALERELMAMKRLSCAGQATPLFLLYCRSAVALAIGSSIIRLA